MIDILSGNNYCYIPNKVNEDYIKELLIGHSIKKVDNNTLQLDNEIKLKFYGNEGCCCGAGCYDITELNDCPNIITNVEFDIEDNEEVWNEELSYRIFVYAENKQIKLLQCDGDDGNGYYGTGYHIDIVLEEDLEVEDE